MSEMDALSRFQKGYIGFTDFSPYNGESNAQCKMTWELGSDNGLWGLYEPMSVLGLPRELNCGRRCIWKQQHVRSSHRLVTFETIQESIGNAMLFAAAISFGKASENQSVRDGPTSSAVSIPRWTTNTSDC